MVRHITGQKVLYLDFDGVLHDEDVWWHPKRGVYMATPKRKLFEWMHILEELLAPYPDVKIVLSTTWVAKRSFAYARRQLSPGLRKRVIGATFHSREMRRDEFGYLSRGMQIAGDVARRQPAAWFALDDDTERWPAWLLHHLIATDGGFGLSDPAVQEAVRARLAAMHAS